MKAPCPGGGLSRIIWVLCLVPGLWLADSSAQDTAVPPDSPAAPAPAKAKRVRKPPAPEPVGETEPPVEGAGGCGKERWSVKTLSDPDFNQVDFGAVADKASVSDLALDPGQQVWPSFDPKNPVLPADLRIAGPDSEGYAGPSSLETAVIRVHGTLVCYKVEKDGDYHVVIADSKLTADQIPDCSHWPQTGPLRGQTMIVEFPDPACARSNPDQDGKVRQSEFAGQFGDARKQFQAFLNLQRLPAPASKFFQVAGAGSAPGGRSAGVVVRGVKFFDPYHRQDGVSRYGVELHPVLCFKDQAHVGSGTECDPY
ncbi:MAG: hypothetical protein HY077_11935 [Elusimicrobia bacterium]|nr:hypothetical protein [Elusimicrobiota bacterium]